MASDESSVARDKAPFGLVDVHGPKEFPAQRPLRMFALSANLVQTIVFRSVLVSA